jgi:hypothetical protein
MKAAPGEILPDTSSTDAAELLVAELRAGRKRLQNLIRLVSEEAGREFGTMRVTRAAKTPSRYKCKGPSGSRALAMAARTWSPPRRMC